MLLIANTFILWSDKMKKRKEIAAKFVFFLSEPDEQLFPLVSSFHQYDDFIDKHLKQPPKWC